MTEVKLKKARKSCKKLVISCYKKSRKTVQRVNFRLFVAKGGHS